MARRTKPENIMKKAVDNRDPYDFAWALLEIARTELALKGKFETLSMRDVKNLLQALMQQASTDAASGKSNSGQAATIHELADYIK